jgi:hypothetical protein
VAVPLCGLPLWSTKTRKEKRAEITFTACLVREGGEVDGLGVFRAVVAPGCWQKVVSRDG